MFADWGRYLLKSQIYEPERELEEVCQLDVLPFWKVNCDNMLLALWSKKENGGVVKRFGGVDVNGRKKKECFRVLEWARGKEK